MFAYLRRMVQYFVVDRRGTIGVMAVGAIPVLTVLVGAAVDYARLENVRSHLQHAADAAALAVAQAQVLDTGSTEKRGDALIDANLEDLGFATLVKRDVQDLGLGQARVSLTAKVDTLFLGLVGFDDFEVAAVSEASFEQARDVQITVLLDNSGSMLIGASPDDIAAFERMFGCAFACHMPHGSRMPTSQTAALSGYKTRLDVARDAIIEGFRLTEEGAFADQADSYFDIYTFAYTLKKVASGTSEQLNRSGGAAVKSIRAQPHPGRGDRYAATDYQLAFEVEDDVLRNLDAHPDRDHFLLLVTDGVADYNHTGRVMEPFDSRLCEKIKEQGIRIGVIYTTYFDIPNNSFWRTHIKPFSPQIAPKLAECATPGWFFEAEYGPDLDAAFQELMRLVRPQPKLSR